MTKQEKLLEYEKKILDLNCTINILNWELRCDAPVSSKDYLSDVIADYELELFKLKKSEKYGKLLSDFIGSEEFKKISEEEARYVKSLYEHFNDDKKIPDDFYRNYVSLLNKSNMVWESAKENNDYASFKPYLARVIDETKKLYKFKIKKNESLYNTMLNDYEYGMDSKTIDKLFNELKEALVPLIKKLKTKNIKEYKQTYTKDELMDAAKILLEYIGFDMKRGTLGIYPHGFTETMNKDDVRIAFKHGDKPLDFVSTIIHEGGHGIFEQNIGSNLVNYENVPLNNLLDLHESQSRFYENILGRNINFWIPIYPKIKEILHLDLTLDEFVEQLNYAHPSLIRTEADELTYCMHIIIRYEIERMIFDEDLSVDDLPKVWNELYQKYLGVEPKNDSEGLMQDVHWAEGALGYFPSYLLGTIYDGMYLEAIEESLGSVDDLLRNGKILDITKFLNENIHKFGGAYTAKEVIERVCGKEISVKPIVKYFENKYKN